MTGFIEGRMTRR